MRRLHQLPGQREAVRPRRGLRQVQEGQQALHPGPAPAAVRRFQHQAGPVEEALEFQGQQRKPDPRVPSALRV